MRKTLVERFNQKVFIPAGSPVDNCHIWMAAKDRDGYGMFGQVSEKRVRRVKRAHRVSYELFNGAIPEGMSVLHICDNPACVNPAHLSIGTHKDNMRDMKSKGRSNWGKHYKTHCHNGHEYTEGSYYIEYNGYNGARRCITCRTAQGRWKVGRKP